MPRRKSLPLTQREAEIMDVLWQREQATADEIRAGLTGRPHDSTVRTLLRILETKGHVRREVVGKAHVYRPVTAQAAVQQGALQSLLVRFFGGSAEHLVLRLLEEEHLSVRELRALLESAPRPRRKPRQEGKS